MLKTPLTPPLKNNKAFTLLELIVVIGVMAILAGILFSATNLNQQSTPLESAQQLLSQAFSNARAQAILKSNQSRLLIYAEAPSSDDSSGKYLRYFKVVVETEPGSDQWETVLRGEYLPENAYMVPYAKALQSDWPVDRPASIHDVTLVKHPVQDADGPLKTWLSYNFLSTGRVSKNYYKLVLANGYLEDGKIEYSHEKKAIGIKLNSYGLQFMVNTEEELK